MSPCLAAIGTFYLSGAWLPWFGVFAAGMIVGVGGLVVYAHLQP